MRFYKVYNEYKHLLFLEIRIRYNRTPVYPQWALKISKIKIIFYKWIVIVWTYFIKTKCLLSLKIIKKNHFFFNRFFYLLKLTLTLCFQSMSFIEKMY